MIKKIWTYFSQFGVSDKLKHENHLTILYNRIALISVLVLCSFGLILFVIEPDPSYWIVSTSIGMLYALVLYLNKRGQIYWARFCVSFGTVLWMSIYHISYGGFVSQSFAAGAATFSVFIAFQSKTKEKHIIFLVHIAVYLLALVYSLFFPPLIERIDLPIAAIISFFITMCWTGAMFMSYNHQQQALINSLTKKNKELKQTTNEMERFSYIASHDLKSPLITISSFGELILRDIKNKDYDKIEEKMDFLISGSNQMKFIIEEILELSQVKNISESERELIDLNIVLEKAKLNLKTEITESNAIIYAEELPEFLANEIEFLLIFQNLIQNAIKYNKSEKPTIYISAEDSSSSLRLTFKDNGIGIDEKHYERVFEFFQRLHNNSDYPGTGVGLGLCKRIVDNYHGTIEIQSVVGKGSSFIFDFPKDDTSDQVITENLIKEMEIF